MTTKTSLAADAARLRTSLANVVGSMSPKQLETYDALFTKGTTPDFLELVLNARGAAHLFFLLASAAWIGARSDAEERAKGK